MAYAGTKKFHEGKRSPAFWFGEIGEFMINRESYDVYKCPRCGKIEFFDESVGKQYRTP